MPGHLRADRDDPISVKYTPWPGTDRENTAQVTSVYLGVTSGQHWSSGVSSNYEFVLSVFLKCTLGAPDIPTDKIRARTVIIRLPDMVR